MSENNTDSGPQPKGWKFISKYLLMPSTSARSVLDSPRSEAANESSQPYFRHFRKLSFSGSKHLSTSSFLSKGNSLDENQPTQTRKRSKSFGCNFLMDDPKLFNIFGEQGLKSESSFVLVDKAKKTKLKIHSQKKRLIDLSKGSITFFSLHSNPDKSRPEEYVSKTKEKIFLSNITSLERSKSSSSVIEIICYEYNEGHIHEPTLSTFALRFRSRSLAKKWFFLLLQEIYSVSLIIENMAAFIKDYEPMSPSTDPGSSTKALWVEELENNHLPCLYKKRVNLYIILAKNLHPKLKIDEYALNRKLFHAKGMYKEIVAEVEKQETSFE